MIAIISGTNRKQAYSYQIALLYQKALEAMGEQVILLDLDELPPDFIVSALYENNGKNDIFNTFVEKIQRADKYIFIVAEYNNSFPGVLKAFIDGLPYPSDFKLKPVALVGLSAGPQGGLLALSHLTDILHYLGAMVLPLKVRLPQIQKHFLEGQIQDVFLNTVINEQIKMLVEFASTNKDVQIS
ncbi:MAG: NAD(P)H-dependent oxidoreductase [Bernardetiaceae bacterium]|nr:NAD(P)H-dependent oxidoreductase [Bernardetiaceae bacterium]